MDKVQKHNSFNAIDRLKLYDCNWFVGVKKDPTRVESVIMLKY
jgi:hypothetical protein